MQCCLIIECKIKLLKKLLWTPLHTIFIHIYRLISIASVECVDKIKIQKPW